MVCKKCIMTNNESECFRNALCQQGFSQHEIGIINAILQGEGNCAQEDILNFADKNLTYLTKLSWYRRVMCAAKQADLKIKK